MEVGDLVRLVLTDWDAEGHRTGQIGRVSEASRSPTSGCRVRTATQSKDSRSTCGGWYYMQHELMIAHVEDLTDEECAELMRWELSRGSV